MKSKRLILFFLLIILSTTVILSQKKEARLNNTQRSIKDTINFNKAKTSLYNGNWVFDATKLSEGNKNIELRGSVRHFIINKGDSCYLQLYSIIFSGFAPGGQNGYSYGKCQSSHNEITKDRKGRISKQMTVDGNNLHADIIITLNGDGANANVDINQITSKRKITLRYIGRILPLKDSEYSYLIQ